MRNAVAARHLTLRVPTQSTLPPLISLSGHNPLQEAKAEALRNLLKSGPISPNRVWAIPTRMPGIFVRSIPKTRFSSDRKTPSAENVIDEFVRHRLGELPGSGGFEDGRIPDAQVPLFARIVRVATREQ